MRRASIAFGLCVLLGASVSQASDTPKMSAGEARRAAAAGENQPLDERYIEKRSGDYLFKLTLRPGVLAPQRVADVTVEVLRVLQIPDPQWGDRLPMSNSNPIATVQAPALAAKKNRRRAEPPPSRYKLWPITNPGEFGFHFSPAHDGIYTVTIKGSDPTLGEGLELVGYEASFRLGVGTEAAQTEQSQGTAAVRRTARRPVGMRNTLDRERQLQALMEEIGERFLDLEDMIDNAPAKGPNKDAAAQARAIAQLFEKSKGLAPRAHTASAEEFEKLAAAAPAFFEEIAAAAEGQNRKAPRAAFEKTELQSCLQCHTKFRWNATESLETWPAFQSIDWTKNQGSRR